MPGFGMPNLFAELKKELGDTIKSAVERLGGIGPWRVKPCDEYITYTARRYCQYGDMGTAIYKDIKTMLCRRYPSLRYRVRVDDYEVEVPICELLFGKRGSGDFSGWASFFNVVVDGDCFWLYFDRMRYEMAVSRWCPDECPSPKEAEEMVLETASSIFPPCQD